VPGRGRRRRPVLAAARSRRRDRLCSRSRRLAPPPLLDPAILEAAGWLRKSGGPPRGEMALAVQFPGATQLVRADLWERPLLGLLLRGGADLPRRLGDRAVPVPLSGPQLPLVPRPH